MPKDTLNKPVEPKALRLKRLGLSKATTTKIVPSGLEYNRPREKTVILDGNPA